MRECSKKEGVVTAESVETLGVDLMTSTKQLGAEEKAGRKIDDVRFSLIKKNRVFQKNYVRIGVGTLLRTGFVLARGLGGQAVGVAPTERLKLRRQMAAGKRIGRAFFVLGGE